MTQYPHLKKLFLGLLISAVVGFGSSLTAKADLIQLTEAQLQGVESALSDRPGLQSPDNSTRKSGGVLGTHNLSRVGDFGHLTVLQE